MSLDVGMSTHCRRSVLRVVARRSAPHFIEATIVPVVLFYLCLVTLGLGAAYIGALAWSYGALVVRRARGRPVPPLLILAIVGISIRTLVAVMAHSSFVYFMQPILATVAMGLVFLVSIAVGRPLIAMLAHEFWPIMPEHVSRPGVTRLFRNLTFVWAGVNLATALTTLVLLMVLPLNTFVAAKQIVGFLITSGGVFITVSSSLNMARREGLVSAYPAR